MTLSTLFFIGFAASFLGSLIGLGGGFIIIPLLTLILDFPIQQAVFFSLSAAFVLSSIRNIQNRELIRRDREALKKLLIFAAAGAFAAAFVHQKAPDLLIHIVFSVCLIVFSIFFMLGKSPTPQKVKEGNALKIARAIFFAGGSLAGFLGIGGGIVAVPTLHKLLKFPMQEATKLSFVFISIACAFALMVHFHFQKEALYETSPILLASLLGGTLAGAYLGHWTKISDQKIKFLFGGVLLLLGILKLIRALG